MRTIGSVILALLASIPAWAECPFWTVPSATWSKAVLPPGPLFVADLDGDHFADVVSFRIGIQILYSSGNVARETATLQPNFLFSAAAVADFTGDGRPDIAAAQAAGPEETSLELFVNRGGKGSFDEPRYLDAPRANRMAAGDLNGDGRLDLVLLAGPGSEIVILLGDGHGGFAAPIHTGFTAEPSALFIADFTGDGKMDVAVSNAIYAGDGTGAVKPYATLSFPSGVSSFAAGDFDHDGRMDLAAFSPSSNAITVLRSTGSGLTQTARLTSVTAPSQLAVADFDGSGSADLAVLSGSGVAIFLSDGAGGFRRAPDLTGSFGGMLTADFNGDGLPDLLLYSTVSGAAYFSLRPGLGNGTFASVRQDAASFSSFLEPADLDGDGETDLVAAGSTPGFQIWSGTVGADILHNHGGKLTVEHLKAIQNPVFGLRLADLDGDGLPEILVSEKGSTTPPLRPARVVVIRLQHGSPAGASVLEAPGTDESWIVTGDFDGDGKSELLMTRGDGTADLVAFTPEPHVIAQVTLPEGSVPVAAADLDGDRRDDVVVDRESSVEGTQFRKDGFVSTLFSLGGGAFAAPVTVTRDTTPFAVDVGDFDGDGRKDVVVEGGENVILAYSNGRTFTLQALDADLSARLYLLAPVADVDQDGRADLIGSDPDAQQLTIAFLGGRGLPPHRVAVYPIPASVRLDEPYWVSVAVADLDRNGSMDLVAVSNSAVSVYPGLCGRGPTTRRRTR